ncbi:MAG TPA: response regulator [Azospirillum sp.]
MGHQDAQTPPLSANPLVVVVDDDPSIVDGLALVLEGWGYDVLTARSLEELAAGLKTQAAVPALVLADHFLPGGTGADAVEMVRRHCGATVPAIILTGDTTPERQAEATAAGYRLMHKPVLPAPLRTAIDELIRG